MKSTTTTLAQEIQQLGPWFHNLYLPGDLQTAPDHALGDFPRSTWQRIAPHVPQDLTGWTVLDIGCNAGFYSFELARRGARVTAIDHDPHYLQQARWAAEKLELEDRVSFRQQQVYDLAHDTARFDLVWFMGVFYHLRYPMLGLDIAARKVNRLMMFQTMTMPGEEVVEPPEDFGLDQRPIMRQPGWPTMAFIEKRLAEDPTNWWAPNHACVEAVLRSAGLQVLSRVIPEAYLCQLNGQQLGGVEELLHEEYLAATGQSEHEP